MAADRMVPSTLADIRPCWANVRPEGSSDARKGGQQDMAARKSSGGGSGKRGRSAISGRFVKQSTVRKNPRTTVNESAKRKK